MHTPLKGTARVSAAFQRVYPMNFQGKAFSAWLMKTEIGQNITVFIVTGMLPLAICKSGVSLYTVVLRFSVDRG